MSKDAITCHRELVQGLRRIARRTPAGDSALRSLFAMTVGPMGAAPSPKERALLELAFAAAARSHDAVERKIDRLHALAAPRERVITVLQLAVLMSDGPAVNIAAGGLARFDALDAARHEAQTALRRKSRSPDPGETNASAGALTASRLAAGGADNSVNR